MSYNPYIIMRNEEGNEASVLQNSDSWKQFLAQGYKPTNYIGGASGDSDIEILRKLQSGTEGRITVDEFMKARGGTLAQADMTPGKVGAYNEWPSSTNYNNNATSTASGYNPMSRDQYMNTYSDIINKQYGKAQNQLQEQQQQLKPMYQQQRNMADVQTHQASRRLSELMAQRGMGRTGTMMTSMAGVQNQRMGQLADINRDQSFANTQMANRLAELEQGRAADLSRASLGYEDYGFRAEQLKQSLASLMGNYGGQQTLAGKQFDSDQAYRNWQQQFQQGQFDWQKDSWQQGFDADQAYRNQQTDWQRQQAMMNLLMNYYNNSTSGWQMPSSVKPADYLEQLFKSAGYR